MNFIDTEFERHADLTLVFGHHPVTDTGVSDDTWLYYGAPAFVELLDQGAASLYGYGHTHRHSEVLFKGDTYTGDMAGGGVVYFNIDSLGKSTENHFSVIAVDCNGVSTKTQAIDAWPLVLITTPVNGAVGGIPNPYAYSVPAATENPIRALVFDAEAVSQVQYRIDGAGQWYPMQQVSGSPSLWEARWDNSGTAEGPHTIEVQAAGSAIRSDVISVHVAAGTPDTTAPTPTPMTWAAPPHALDSTSIGMTATTAVDPSGVEYYFDCVSEGCNDSGWQAGPDYVDTGLAPSTSYGYAVKARDLSVNRNETALSQVSSATTDEAAEVCFQAEGETTARGTVEGDFADTHADDDTYEALTEEIKTGRWSLLEHTWTFNITGGASVVFKVQAHHSENTEGDDFIFAYSLDNTTFSSMLRVEKTLDDDHYQSFELPAYTSGTIHIRVKDTDMTKGSTGQDTLYVDDMFISTSGSSHAPAQAFNPDPPNGATDVPATPTLTWSPGEGAGWHEVYFGTDAENLELASAGQTETRFTPDPLEGGATCFWRIDEGNTFGTTVGALWQFTTTVGACTPETVSVASVVTSTLKGPAGTSYGQAVATIRDNCGDPVGDATVEGEFTGDFSGEVPQTAATDSSGRAVFMTEGSLKKPVFGFQVNRVEASGLVLQP